MCAQEACCVYILWIEMAMIFLLYPGGPLENLLFHTMERALVPYLVKGMERPLLHTMERPLFHT